MTSPGQGSRPVIEVAEKSDPGRDPSKQVNEDACAYRETRLGHLLIVCDGMGGHQAGREASNLAVQTMLAMMDGAPEGLPPGQVLARAIEQAGRAVFQLGGAGSSYGRPGSTVVSLLIHPGGTEVAHVGDSRAYCIRGGQIHALTRDHSMVQQMIEAGFLHPDEAYGHPDANKITRALGLLESTDVELLGEPLLQEAGDIFLLATDGLFDVARPEEALELVLASSNLEEATAKLVDLANTRGGPDNITVQLARVIEAGLRVPADGLAGRTQLSGAALDAHALEGRATVLEAPAPLPPDGARPFSPGETLLIAGTGTLVEDAPVTQRAPIAPTRADDPIAEETPKPSQRGGIYLVLGICAVSLIITAVSVWLVVGRQSSAPNIANVEPTAPPVVTAAPIADDLIAPQPASSARDKSHRHPHWKYRQEQQPWIQPAPPDEPSAPAPPGSSNPPTP